jgi:diguanylate cyclase (GGDEF)-like protein
VSNEQRDSEWFDPGTTRRARRQLRAFALLTLVGLIGAVGARQLDRRIAGVDVASWGSTLQVIALVMPAVLLLVRSRTDDPRSATWRTLAVGVVCNAYAEALLLFAPERTFPGPVDVAKVLAYSAFAVALARSAAEHTSGVRSVRLDGAIIGVSLGAAATALWFEPLVAASGDATAIGMAMAYPLLDAVLLVLIAASLAPVRYRPTVRAVVSAIAVALLAAGDLMQLRSVALSTPTSSLSRDLVVAAVWLLGIGAWMPTRRRVIATRAAALGSSVIPLLAALVALAVLGYGISRDVHVLASILALAAVSLVIARTALTVRELRTVGDAFRMARTDELTGLANRRGFLEGLEKLIEVAPEKTAVIVADLNGFKDVNDSLGHHAGDMLLAKVADRLADRLGTSSLLARLGGDEFGIVSMVSDAAGGLRVAKDLRRTLEAPFDIEGVSVRIGGSFGVAMYPNHGWSRQSLLRCADVAMYVAKRNQTGVSLYQATIDFNTRSNLELLDDLREAIELEALDVHYQPKLDLCSGRVIGSEALVRWDHRTRGLLYPDAFVPLAERSGLIPGLTKVVMRKAVAYHAQQVPHLGVSVNISHRDLVDDNLVDFVRGVLDEFHFPASQLTLEITETAIANDPERAGRSIQLLRQAGLRLSIDDFGVGYSSMARLLELQVDEVKIDKSFTMAAIDDPRAMAIIRSTAQLAAALQLHVVAEGVETESVLGQLRAAGVDGGQGYWISKPLAVKDYERFLGVFRPLPPPRLDAAEVPLPNLPTRVHGADGTYRSSSLTAGSDQLVSR